MKSLFQGLFSTALLVVVVSGVLMYLFGTLVPPGSIGVRQIKFGPGQGFSDVGLSPGYHWAVPFYSTVHVIPETLQMIHFHRDPDDPGAPIDQNVFAALEIQSADRATVDVDVSVIYSFYPNAEAKVHGGPADLFKLGLSQDAWRNEVRRRSEDQLKRKLGNLQTAKFYQPDDREPLLEEAQRDLQTAIAPSGIKVEAILLRRFSYREDRIDNAIFQKNLQEQEERRNIAQSRFVEAEGLVKKVEAEKNAEIETVRVQAESNARVLRSEGDLYTAQRKAEADLLIAKAQAEVDKLKAGALSQNAGVAAYLGRELAPLLRSLKGGVIADMDPYDLGAMAKRLSGNETAEHGGAR